MQLISLIFVIIMMLSLASGIIIFLGVEKGYRLRGAMYLLAMVGFSIMLLSRIGNFMENILAVIWLFYLAYIAFMVRKSKKTMVSRGWMMMLSTVGILGGASVLFSVALPHFNVHLEWITPFLVWLMILGHYFIVLKYEIISLKILALRAWTYAIFGSVAIISYMLIFTGIGTGLFHIEMSGDILALSLIMIIIVCMILPVINEMYMKIRIFISTDKLDTVYLVKKLNKLATRNVSLSELSQTLARYARFEYVGIILGSKVYGSKPQKFSREQIVEIGLLETEKDSVWLKLSGHAKKYLAEKEIIRVAELRDIKGVCIGQLLIGRPRGKSDILKADLDELDAVVNLIASIVDSKEKSK